MKNLLIALLSVAVIVLAFLLWKATCKPEKESFGFTEEYNEYLKNLKMENAFIIHPDTGKYMVKAYIDSLAKYRGHERQSDEWKSKNIEKYIMFSIPELDKLMTILPKDNTRKDFNLKIYLGHYTDDNEKKIRKYLHNKLDPISDDNLNKYYMNRNTVIFQLATPDGNNFGEAMNVGSICPPKCSQPEDEYYPIK